MRSLFPKTTPVILAALALLMPLEASAFGSASPQQSLSQLLFGEAAKEKFTIGGSIVRSDRPLELRGYLQRSGIEVARQANTRAGEALMVLHEAPDSPRMQALARQPFVQSVSRNNLYKTSGDLALNDTKYPDQWNLRKISAADGWHATTGSAQTVVAVLDTGILSSQQWGAMTAPLTQPDFPDERLWKNPGENGLTALEGPTPNCTSRGLTLDKNCNNRDDDGNGRTDDWRGWDFMGGWVGDAGCPNYREGLGDTYVSGDNDPQPYSCDNPLTGSHNVLNKDHYDGGCAYSSGACFIGHGTMVGSVAAAAAGNGQHIAGIDHAAQVMDVRVLDGYGYTDSLLLTQAIEYAGTMGADVINMSLALVNPDTGTCSPGYVDAGVESAMAAAKSKGAVIVGAAGNAGDGNVCFPGSSAHAIAVGASDETDVKASFSTYGPALDIVAPGIRIPVANAPSAYVTGAYYPTAAGTSLAAPHVAGAASLLKARYPEATPDQTYNRLVHFADKVEQMKGAQRTDTHGYGRLNVRRSLIWSARPDGLLIKKPSDPTVFAVLGGKKHGFVSPNAVASNGYILSRTITVPEEDLSLYPTGAPIQARPGTLLKGQNETTVYVMDQVSGVYQKRGITSSAIFEKFGFRWADIKTATSAELAAAADGPVVDDSSPRPNGAVFKTASNPTVYAMLDGQKRGFTTPLSFLSNGFQWENVVVIPESEVPSQTGAPYKARPGTIIKYANEPTVYVVGESPTGSYRKHGLPSPTQLYSIGLKFEWMAAETAPYDDGTPLGW